MKKYRRIINAAAAAAPGVLAKNASLCKNSTLDENMIKGKLVMCTIEKFEEDREEKSNVIRQGGGIGMILVDPFGKDIGFQFEIPVSLIGRTEAEELQAYLNKEKNPVAKILPTTTVLNARTAPKMAIFLQWGLMLSLQILSNQT
ncbi:hypothetical protein Sjap_001196 [Stephania japonica]|uniref:PA domain-containing protein n=1 Tax=Stephania japonica TaxID=461633 RepID=A0AAP0PUT5_9MAGN